MLVIDGALLDVLKVLAGDYHRLVNVAASVSRTARLTAPSQVEERVVQWGSQRIVVLTIGLTTRVAAPVVVVTTVCSRLVMHLMILMVGADSALTSVSRRLRLARLQIEAQV